MKVLVGIASYGIKNDRYLSLLIDEYKSMKYDVDVVIFSNIPRPLDKCKEVIVGLPSENPWSLPFAHKKIFAERADVYDIFIYTENDILIKERNIEAFLRVTSILPDDEIGGFMRYEINSSNQKNYLDVHGSFHWDPKSVKTIGDHTFAHFTNEHSGCYMLMKEQLKRAIASGGFLTPPHEGKYDLLCSAATDPYTQCGFTKVICISHFADFEIHHLPNAYVGEAGINQREFNRQLLALREVAEGKRPRVEMFEQMRDRHSSKQGKWYYELCNNTVLSLMPQNTKSVLSIGCGSAETESQIVGKGIECLCTPLDNVIGSVAEMKGVKTLSPDIDDALNGLSDRRFDCILMLMILQHADDPSKLLMRFSRLLSPRGVIIGTISNQDYVEDLLPMRYKTGTGSDRVRSYHLRDTVESGLKILGRRIMGYLPRKSKSNMISKNNLKMWLMDSGIKAIRIDYITDNLSHRRRRLAIAPLKSLLADKIYFLGRNNK